jgi:putative ABC transport system permease protein
MVNDIRFAVRQLAKSPGFAAVAVLTVAVGIGSCAAIFSVVNSVLLFRPPYPEPDRVVVFKEILRGRSQEFLASSGHYDEWQTQARSFESIAFTSGGPFILSGAGEPLQLKGQRISASALPTLRVAPLLGRNFLPEEAAIGPDANVAILSYGLWQRQFGGRADVMGQVLRLDGRPVTVVGVMPRDSGMKEGVEIFTPRTFGEFERRYFDTHWLYVFGRLRPGVTLAEAQSEMNVIAERSARSHRASEGWGVKLVPIVDTVVGEVRPVLLSLMAAVAFLLLIACANVANLLLARATSRSKEMAVRAALGASRARIIRQLLVESILLSLLAGALGLLIARGALSVLLALAPENLPRTREIALDGRALTFTFAVAMLTGLAFGLAPAFQATRGRLHQALKDASRTATDGSRRQRLRSALVIGEIAMALVLLAGAGLLMRSFTSLLDVSPGFDPRNATVARAFLPVRYGTPEARAQSIAFAQAAVDRMQALPGVQTAAVASTIPFSDFSQTMPFTIVGRALPSDADRPVSTHYNIGPEYFRAMGIPVRRGRAFEAHDSAGSAPVAIINESLANSFFAGVEPVGRHISIGGGPPSEIVGVVGDIKAQTLDGAVSSQTYRPFAQQPVRSMAFVIRAAGPPIDLTNAVRTIFSGLNRDVPTQDLRLMSTLVSGSIARQRFAMTLFAAFSGVALLLAAIGIYGVIAYSVSRRTGEIAIRMALGAPAGSVVGLVLRQGGVLVGLGLTAGVAAALVLTRFLGALLYATSPSDPVTFVAVPLLLALVATLACLIPARRAARVDPMAALRCE